MRSTVRAGATNRPGVYRMLSGDGEIVYVGKSKQVRSRLLSYFRGSYPEDKGARIIREASAIDWEYTPSEFAALLHELRSIKRWRPRFNVRMKRDAQHYAFIKVSRAPAPKLQVVRGAGTDDGGVYYGPYVGAHRVNDAIRELNDVLGLRDCSRDVKIHFADQRELFQLTPRTPGCIRHEIRKCLGPCVGGCTAGEYDAQLAAAREFLDGTSDGPLESLRSQMADLAERMEFERAGVMRDKLRRLEALREQLERMRFAVETLSFVYTVSGHDGDDRCYLIRRGRVRDECPAPTTAAGRRALAARVREVFTPPERDSAAVATPEIDELLLLSSWFRRFPDELARTRPAGEFGVPAPV
jgi:excinuclease ABC subunit C